MAETGQQRATGGATDESAPTHAGNADKLIIFISYSKSDTVFADRLVEALEANGFSARIDRRNLEYGEKWQGMLRDFIAEADTVVFVVSPRSVASQWCKWEVAQVAALSKRLVPIVLEPAPQEALPPQIADWQLMPFEADGDFNAQVASLAAVLLTDRDWVKEHTRLAGLAATWDREQRRSDALIQGRPLAAVEAWKSKPRKFESQAERACRGLHLRKSRRGDPAHATQYAHCLERRHRRSCLGGPGCLAKYCCRPGTRPCRA